MYLYGASGHAKVIIDIIKAQGGVVEGLVDDNPNLKEFQFYMMLPGCLPLLSVSVIVRFVR